MAPATSTSNAKDADSYLERFLMKKEERIVLRLFTLSALHEARKHIQLAFVARIISHPDHSARHRPYPDEPAAYTRRLKLQYRLSSVNVIGESTVS
jgi:hypothetical protein